MLSVITAMEIRSVTFRDFIPALLSQAYRRQEQMVSKNTLKGFTLQTVLSLYRLYPDCS